MTSREQLRDRDEYDVKLFAHLRRRTSIGSYETIATEEMTVDVPEATRARMLELLQLETATTEDLADEVDAIEIVETEPE